MTTADDETTQTPRAGTYADLARRIERMEVRHEDLAKEVAGLTATTAQVVQNQKHAEDINELRFKALDTAVSQIGGDLKGFMARIDGIISGEVQTVQSRQGAEMVADYMKWRVATDDALDDLKRSRDAERNQRVGVVETFGAGKAVIITAAAVVTAIIAVLGFLAPHVDQVIK